jgi:hypothetical protein
VSGGEFDGGPLLHGLAIPLRFINLKKINILLCGMKLNKVQNNSSQRAQLQLSGIIKHGSKLLKFFFRGEENLQDWHYYKII